MISTSTRKPPTQSEIAAARQWIRTEFPFKVLPSYNPGQGEKIFKFMEENFGPCDQAWTYLDTDILFKTEEDRAAFMLSWGKWDE
jgi:hypothetical protein